MNKIFTNNIGHLGQIQHASFYRFLSQGIAEELKLIANPFPIKVKLFSPIKRKNSFKNSCKIKFKRNNTKRINIAKKHKKKILIYFLLENCLISNKFYNISEIIRKDSTYSILIFLPLQYSYKKNINKVNDKKEISLFLVKQYIFLGEIPLMTDEGTFIINGCERIVISQIIKSPGVYFQKVFFLKKKIIYKATIISDSGLWSKMQYENKNISQFKTLEDFIATKENAEKEYHNTKKYQQSIIDNIFTYIDEYDFHFELRNIFYKFSNLENLDDIYVNLDELKKKKT
jgi:DNA-directed RNA polymerase beta subunit